MTPRWVCRSLLCVGLMVGVGLKLGCDSGVGFLGLQDYQRDLIVGGLVAAALLGNQGGAADADAAAGQFLPVEGPQGEQGTPGGDGAEGAAGAQGSVGEQGPQGPQGAEGSAGPAGPAGSSGASGGTGSQGPPGVEGAAGPSLFSVYIDDFFALVENTQGELEIDLVSITEPALGNYLDRAPPAAIAFRTAIPDVYTEGNDVTMRLMFHRTGFYNGNCFIFRVDGRRLRDGGPVEVSGDTRYVRINAGDGVARGEGETLDVYLVVDLPINVLRDTGLEYHVGDLKVADLLAFEIANLRRDDPAARGEEDFQDGGRYHLLGVEFFESATADQGARIFYDEENLCCGNPSDGPGLSIPDDHLFISDGEMLRVSRIDDYSVVADIPGTLSTSGGFDDGHHMVFDTIGQRIFVNNHDEQFPVDDQFDVFDTSLNELNVTWGIDLIEPLGMAPLPNGQLLITDEEEFDSGLFRLNADLSLDASASGAFWSGAEGVAYDSIHDRVYVADEDDGDIEIFDGQTLERVGGQAVCGTDGPYAIAVDGSAGRVFFLADRRCATGIETSGYGVHVYDITCDGNGLEYNRTLFGKGGPNSDCWGAIAVSESADRLFVIDYCAPWVEVFDVESLDHLGLVPVGRAGDGPLMITVGHLDPIPEVPQQQ